MQFTCLAFMFRENRLRPTQDHIEIWLYLNGSCSVDLVNCSLVIPINRQMQSDIYLDVVLSLSKWRRHQIILVSSLPTKLTSCQINRVLIWVFTNYNSVHKSTFRFIAIRLGVWICHHPNILVEPWFYLFLLQQCFAVLLYLLLFTWKTR